MDTIFQLTCSGSSQFQWIQLPLVLPLYIYICCNQWFQRQNPFRPKGTGYSDEGNPLNILLFNDLMMFFFK